MSWYQEITQTNVQDDVTVCVRMCVIICIDGYQYLYPNQWIYLEKGDRLDGVYTKRVVIASGESVVAFN